jgi:hypothetical protein
MLPLNSVQLTFSTSTDAAPHTRQLSVDQLVVTEGRPRHEWNVTEVA